MVWTRRIGRWATHVFDGYPTYEEWIAQFDMDTDTPDMAKLAPAHDSHLPVWAEGNVYFGGARKWEKEKNAVVLPDKVTLALEEQDGRVTLGNQPVRPAA